MGFFITLSYFDRKIGPLVFYSYPINDLEKYLTERIPNIMDNVQTEEFVTYSFDKYYSLNYYFEIESAWARGYKEPLLLSAIFDESIEMGMERAILTLCIEFSDWLKSKENVFTGFYGENSVKYQDKENRNSIDKNLIFIKSWVKEFYNAVLDALQEDFEEEDITKFIEKENILMTLKFLSHGPITIENLKKWYTEKYPDDNFYKLIRNLIKVQMIIIPNVGKSKNPPFNVYIAEDIIRIIKLIGLKNRLLKMFVKKYNKESSEEIEKRTKELQEIIENSFL